MSDVKLLPCPFCGNADALYRNPSRGKFQEYCDKCKARGPERDDLNEATSAWNARPAPALTPKQAAADEMFTKLDKIAKWLESLAALSEKQIETCRFESLNDAYRANAKNYKATARDIRSTLAKAGQP